MVSSDTVIDSVEQLKKLPVGTKFVSLPGCKWPLRYEGIRWVKIDVLTIKCLDKKDGMGFDRTKNVSYLPSFKDPLPVRVIEEKND